MLYTQTSSPAIVSETAIDLDAILERADRMLHNLAHRFQCDYEDLRQEATCLVLARMQKPPSEGIRDVDRYFLRAIHLHVEQLFIGQPRYARSLDAPLFDEEGAPTLLDRLPSPVIQNRSLSSPEKQHRASELLNQLSERQRAVVMAAYEFGGDDGLTVDEVRECLGLSKEAFKQVKLRALKKLRPRKPNDRASKSKSCSVCGKHIWGAPGARRSQPDGSSVFVCRVCNWSHVVGASGHQCAGDLVKECLRQLGVLSSVEEQAV